MQPCSPAATITELSLHSCDASFFTRWGIYDRLRFRAEMASLPFEQSGESSRNTSGADGLHESIQLLTSELDDALTTTRQELTDTGHVWRFNEISLRSKYWSVDDVVPGDSSLFSAQPESIRAKYATVLEDLVGQSRAYVRAVKEFFEGSPANSWKYLRDENAEKHAE